MRYILCVMCEMGTVTGIDRCITLGFMESESSSIVQSYNRTDNEAKIRIVPSGRTQMNQYWLRGKAAGTPRASETSYPVRKPKAHKVPGFDYKPTQWSHLTNRTRLVCNTFIQFRHDSTTILWARIEANRSARSPFNCPGTIFERNVGITQKHTYKFGWKIDNPSPITFTVVLPFICRQFLCYISI